MPIRLFSLFKNKAIFTSRKTKLNKTNSIAIIGQDLKVSSSQDKTVRDFVDYKPEAIKILSQEEFEIAGKYNIILTALRDNIKTVKEIHDLYQVEIEDGTKIHRVTQQSIYRYLEDLEKSSLIMVAGYRKTEGVKSSERIYGRSAKIFTTTPSSEMQEMEESQVEFVKNLAKILGIALNVNIENLNLDEFVKFYRQLDTQRSMNVKDLYAKAKTKDTLTEIFSSMSIEQINEAIWYVQQFLPFIQNPEMIDELKSMYE